MNGGDCSRERDVIEAILAGRWPDRTGDDLCEHARECRICGAAADLARAFAAEREAALAEARPLPSGAVWWRAQIRARARATRAATWPIAVSVGATIACIAGLGLAFAPALLAWLREWAPPAATFAPAVHLPALPPPDLPAQSSLPVSIHRVIWIGLAIWLVLTSGAIYLILAADREHADRRPS